MILYTIIILLRFFVVCPFITEVYRKSLDLEPEAAASFGHWRLEATERMLLCTLAKALEMGKTMIEFNVLDKNEMRVDTYLSEGPDCEET